MSTEMEGVIPTMDEVVTAVQKNWGWFLAMGIIMIILGTLAISLPHAATIAVEILIGWLLTLAGAALFVESIATRRCGWSGRNSSERSSTWLAVSCCSSIFQRAL